MKFSMLALAAVTLVVGCANAADDTGACATDHEIAPLGDFLGVTALPDSTLQQLRFREGSPTDKHLAFLARRR